jgi:hypothetical protein
MLFLAELLDSRVKRNPIRPPRMLFKRAWRLTLGTAFAREGSTVRHGDDNLGRATAPHATGAICPALRQCDAVKPLPASVGLEATPPGMTTAHGLPRVPGSVVRSGSSSGRAPLFLLPSGSISPSRPNGMFRADKDDLPLGATRAAAMLSRRLCALQNRFHRSPVGDAPRQIAEASPFNIDRQQE